MKTNQGRSQVVSPGVHNILFSAFFLFGKVKASAVVYIRPRLCLALLAALPFFTVEIFGEQIEKDSEWTDGPWPNKPQNKSSLLSGKMREVSSLSIKMYPQKRHEHILSGESFLEKPSLRVSSAGWENKDSAWNTKTPWDRSDHEARAFKLNNRLQPGNELLAMEEGKTFQDYKQSAKLPKSPDWSSRRSRVGQSSGGGVHLYEGRLTRVRESFWHQEENSYRDLGREKRESLTPEEVEAVLQRPLVGGADLAHGKSSAKAKEQSRSEPRLANGGN